MKKLFYLLIVLALISFSSCSEDDPEIGASQKLKETIYVFNGKEYTITVDISNEEELVFLDGTEYIEELTKIFELPELVTVFNNNDPKLYLFVNDDDYKKSSLFQSILLDVEQHNKFLLEEEDDGGGGSGGSGGGSTSNPGVTFFKRGQLNYSYDYFTRPQIFNEPDFNNILRPNGSSFNDDISSLIIDHAFLRIYEHANYTGRTTYFNNITSTRNIHDLHDIFWIEYYFVKKTWNDRMTSAKSSFQPF